jgi:putative dehydrogenase
MTQAATSLPGPASAMPTVGVVGLGIMGSEYARHLLAAGYKVSGYDVAQERLAALQAAGGVPCTSAKDVAARADVVITALSSVPAYRAAILGPDGVLAAAPAGKMVIDTGTFALDLKSEARALLAERGARMIDAPVTGTRMHAETRDLVMYASGSAADVEEVRAVLQAFAKDVRFVGEFGTGIKLKLVTNHLVAIHTAAAAEALSLARSAQLDLQLVYDVIAGGPGSSAVFGFRGPLIVAERFVPATMRLDVFAKDLETISALGEQVQAATPLLDASRGLYADALAQQMGEQDISATYRILRQRSGDAAHANSTHSRTP